jgi:hypothetical protein
MRESRRESTSPTSDMLVNEEEREKKKKKLLDGFRLAIGLGCTVRR